jgi:hypothetical protein
MLGTCFNNVRIQKDCYACVVTLVASFANAIAIAIVIVTYDNHLHMAL